MNYTTEFKSIRGQGRRGPGLSAVLALIRKETA